MACFLSFLLTVDAGYLTIKLKSLVVIKEDDGSAAEEMGDEPYATLYINEHKVDETEPLNRCKVCYFNKTFTTGKISVKSNISIEIMDRDLGRNNFIDPDDLTMWANGTVFDFFANGFFIGKNGGAYLETASFWEGEYKDTTLTKNNIFFN